MRKLRLREDEGFAQSHIVVSSRVENGAKSFSTELRISVDEDLGPDLTPAIPLAAPKCS